MPPIQCFMLEPTDKEQRALRRFTYSTDAQCPKAEGWGHDATVDIEVGTREGEGSTSGDLWPHDDPRWPTKCEACDYEFKDDDQWQLSCKRLYRRVDTGGEMTLDYRTLPPGAMYWATWYSNDNFGSIFHKERGGGPHLMVNTPGGVWDADSVASNGPGWQWSGTPPNVTATPSIGIQNTDGSWRYHGWLRDGVLTDA